MLAVALTAALATACPFAGERPMIEAELFFGRDIQGHGIVSEAQWADFADQVLAPAFPAGFTVEDASGSWRDGAGRMVHEPTKVVVVTISRGPTLAGKLRGVIGAYRMRFRQQSVGLVSRAVCAAF
ncbi:MAG: DUF3574 domain-containing protein [Alphaproteobacteria bacterium]|nr:DUF3574 domain-containing protein [Alphaproteobacteria bacterium]MBV9693453.1 DUF3574 domain-containing protein [Alphaproteobacteria bacterium]